jgi:hypothetical protein
MPIIIDANRISLCVNGSEEALPIMQALLSRRARVAYGGSKLVTEYRKNTHFFKLITELSRAGVAVTTSATRIDAEEKRLAECGLMVSDDPHILAVANILSARLLYTDDSDLKRDFNNSRLISGPRGKIYNMRNSRTLIRSFGR